MAIKSANAIEAMPAQTPTQPLNVEVQHPGCEEKVLTIGRADQQHASI
jgi:hypothetical protein